jgi:exodeoxyribonuclease VII small subunit
MPVASEAVATYPAPTMPETPTDPADLRFEEAIAELESIIEQIDTGKIGLEEAMVAHRRGRALVARCRSVLDAVEQELDSTETDSPADAS